MVDGEEHTGATWVNVEQVRQEVPLWPVALLPLLVAVGYLLLAIARAAG